MPQVNILAKRDMRIGLCFCCFSVPFMIYEFIISNTPWVWISSFFAGIGIIVFSVAYIKRYQSISEYVLGVNNEAIE